MTRMRLLLRKARAPRSPTCASSLFLSLSLLSSLLSLLASLFSYVSSLFSATLCSLLAAFCTVLAALADWCLARQLVTNLLQNRFVRNAISKRCCAQLCYNQDRHIQRRRVSYTLQQRVLEQNVHTERVPVQATVQCKHASAISLESFAVKRPLFQTLPLSKQQHSMQRLSAVPARACDPNAGTAGAATRGSRAAKSQE